MSFSRFCLKTAEAATRVAQLRSTPFFSLSFAGWLAGICLLLTIPAWAVPAWPEIVTLNQPDGAAIRLYVRGDEWVHWFEDPAGYAVLHDQGQYVYAQLDGQTGRLAPTALVVGRGDPVAAGLQKGQRPTAKAIRDVRMGALPPAQRVAGASGVNESLSAPAGVSPVGGVKNLVVLCQFSDHDTTMIRSTNDFDKIFNAVGGDPTLAPTGSVKDYYKQTSYGAIDLQSTILAWVVLPNTEAYYANGANTGLGTYPNNAQRMCEDALNLVNPVVNFGQFDQDLDGYIDAIDFIHSGYGAEFGGVSGRIWSHKWQLRAEWSSGDVNANGVSVKVSAYHTEPALYGSSGTTITTIGVICHETGHFFGLPDLYDTDNSSEGIGSWCLMANSWGFNNTGRNPPHFSAWCKIQLGWVSPTVISNGVFSAPMVETNKVIYRINNNFPSGEYLLVENRQPYSFESPMGTGGLAIWHIDENRSDNRSEGWPALPGGIAASADWPTSHYKVALLQADGLYELERAINRGNNTDLYRAGWVSAITPNTIPNTYSYKGGNYVSTGIIITNISASGSVMTFRLGLPIINLVSAGTTLTAETCLPTNSAVDPGEAVTMRFAIQNTGNDDTANLVATLLSAGGVTYPTGPQSYGALTAGGPAVSRSFTFIGSGTCGTTNLAILQLQDGATSYGYITNTFTLGVGGGSPLAVVRSNTASISIQAGKSGPGSPYPSTISVSGVSTNFYKLTVTLNNLTHGDSTDLDVLLVGPGGQKCLLMSDAGSGGVSGATLTFDDSASSLPGGSPIATGTYAPTDYTTGDAFDVPAPSGPYGVNLAAFNGINPNGTWSLYIMDDHNGQDGSLNGGWQLNFITNNPGANCSSCGGPGSSAILANLVPSAGTLSPAFTIDTFIYSANVPFTNASLKVTPTAVDTNATIKVNEVSVPSGSPSGAIPLNTGTNFIYTDVISQDLSVTNTYLLVVTRAAGSSNAYLSNLVSSAGALNPLFASNTFSYASGVPFATNSLTVTPTAADSNATIRVNGSLVASGNASPSISLNVGTNVISTVVIAQNATLTNTYTLTVTRAASITRWWDGGSTNIAGNGSGTSTGGSGTWNATLQNWDQGSGQVYAAWDNGNTNIAYFGGAVGTVTNTANVTVGGLLFTNAYTITNAGGAVLNFVGSAVISNTAAVTIASPIAGTGPITKTGSGTLTLMGANSYSGGTSNSSGTLKADGNNALGQGLLTMSGGILSNSVAGVVLTNPVNLAAASPIGVPAGVTFTLSGSITNIGNLIKQGAGILTLTGTNTHTGTTTISNGALLVNGNSAAATGTVTVKAGTTFGGTGVVGAPVRYESGSLAAFTVTPAVNALSNSTCMTFANTVFMTNLTVGVTLPTNLGVGVYVLATNHVTPVVSGALSWTTNSGSLAANTAGTVSMAGNKLILTVAETASTNAYLTSLVLNPAGTLAPAFASNVFTYAASEAYGNYPAVTVVNADPGATNRLIYNGSTNLLPSGVPSSPLPLVLGGTNKIVVQVTAKDGLTLNTYTVNVTMEPQLTMPFLTSQIVGGTLQLSWPADHLGYRLLMQTNSLGQGLSTNWQPVNGTAGITSTNIPIAPGVPSVFYRLVYP